MRCLLAALLLLPPCLHAQAPGPWELEPSETTADLRGVHAVGGGVVWASGSGGTVLRSQDSGFEWQNCATPPGAEKLDFRAIWAFDDQTAIVMSSGPGALSRLYKTTDGCSHWTLLYTNPDQDGFWDGLVFLDRKQGYILGDPLQAPGRTAKEFQLFVSLDGGGSWHRQVQDSYDEMGADEGAGAFAASNSALTGLGHHLWFGTGGKLGGYVFLGDRYASSPLHSLCTCSPMPPEEVWVTHHVFAPIPLGPAASVPRAGSSPTAIGKETAGVFSVALRDEQHGVATGGDYAKPNESLGTAAWSEDGGAQWIAATRFPGGYRSAVAWDADNKLWITVGPNGSDLSRDDGRTWQTLEHAPADAPKGGEWNALSLPWAVGPHGRIGKLNPLALPPVQVAKPAPVPR